MELWHIYSKQSNSQLLQIDSRRGISGIQKLCKKLKYGPVLIQNHGSGERKQHAEGKHALKQKIFNPAHALSVAQIQIKKQENQHQQEAGKAYGIEKHIKISGHQQQADLPLLPSGFQIPQIQDKGRDNHIGNLKHIGMGVSQAPS